MRCQIPSKSEVKKVMEENRRLANRLRELDGKQRSMLRRRLEELGITQADAAKKARLSPQRVNDYLRGRRDLPDPSLRRLLNATG